MHRVDITVPMLGESITEAVIVRWYKNVGDVVQQDDTLLEVETDKVTLEINAPYTGIVAEISAALGDTVIVGQCVAVLELEEKVDVKAPVEPLISSTASPEPSVPLISDTPLVDSTPIDVAAREPFPEIPADLFLKASPSVRKKMWEDILHHDPAFINDADHTQNINAPVDLDTLPSNASVPETSSLETSSSETILLVEPEISPNDDSEIVTLNLAWSDLSAIDQFGKPLPAFLKEKPSQETLSPDTHQRQTTHTRLSPLRLKVASRLKEAQNTAAILTTFNEIDMTAVKELRNRYQQEFQTKHGIKLGFMSFFVTAVVAGLRKFPIINSQIHGNDCVQFDYCDIGIAVSAQNGLVVPVLRNAEALSLAAIEKAIYDFGQKAAQHTLTLSELSGGTFTISNGGIFGSLLSTPILNPPQSAILGIHNIQERPIAYQGTVVIRPMMYVALSYDHRLIDGKDAVLFLAHIKESIENPGCFLLGL